MVRENRIAEEEAFRGEAFDRVGCLWQGKGHMVVLLPLWLGYLACSGGSPRPLTLSLRRTYVVGSEKIVGVAKIDRPVAYGG